MNKAAEQDIDFDATEAQDVEVEAKEEETSSEVEIEIVDDTPEEDKGRARRAEGVEPDIPDDEELESYSEGVQKRLKKMKWEFHEERRAKEESERLKEEAVTYAQKIKEENDKLKETLEKSEGVLVDQAKTRVESQIAQAKAKLKEAHEVGDTDALIEAQENLTNLQNEKYRYENYKPPKRQEAQEFQPQQQPVKEPPPQAMEWWKKNTWFEGSEPGDKALTGYAYGIQAELQSQGVELNSKEYYDKIDAAMKEAFPSKFGVAVEETTSQQPRTGAVVAPTSRTSKKPRKVKLTPSAAALAKRLGLTPEQYAAQLMKES